MSLVSQAKLLRILQERMIRRVGGTTSIPIDIRVIVATNKNLKYSMAQNEFREDLFYRISGFPIFIPPLRERREDIPLLVMHFLKKHTESVDKSISGISTSALQLLLQYDWPGNVRELENTIERAIWLETTDTLQADNILPQFLPEETRKEIPVPKKVPSLVEVEREALIHALEISSNKVTEAAQLLGINRVTLYRKLKKFDLTTKR